MLFFLNRSHRDILKMGTLGRSEYSVHFWIFCANLCTLWDIPQYIGNDNSLLIISFPIYKMTMRKSPWDVWGWDLHSWSFFLLQKKQQQKTCFSTTPICWLYVFVWPVQQYHWFTGYWWSHKYWSRYDFRSNDLFLASFLFRFDLRLWKCGQNLILINTHHHGESLDEGKNAECKHFPFPEWK